MKVYTVWYKMDFGTALWMIKATEESARKEVEKILTEGYGTEAWYNEEVVTD